MLIGWVFPGETVSRGTCSPASPHQTSKINPLSCLLALSEPAIRTRLHHADLSWVTFNAVVGSSGLGAVI